MRKLVSLMFLGLLACLLAPPVSLAQIQDVPDRSGSGGGGGGTILYDQEGGSPQINDGITSGQFEPYPEISSGTPAAGSCTSDKHWYFDNSVTDYPRICNCHGDGTNPVCLDIFGPSQIADGQANARTYSAINGNLNFVDGNTVQCTVGGTLPVVTVTCEVINKTWEAEVYLSSVASTDDNLMVYISPTARTVTSIGCKVASGTVTTAPTFTLEDDDGNAMTITGTNPTCAAVGTDATFAAVTAGNSLAAGEGVRVDVTNTPDGDDNYIVILRGTIP